MSRMPVPPAPVLRREPRVGWGGRRSRRTRRSRRNRKSRGKKSRKH